MTDIHAAIPNSIMQEVKEAQMRGEDIPLEPGPVENETKLQQLVKGKERIKATPTSSKVRRLPTEDEENLRRRGATQEPESDPESDWIPGPNKTQEPAVGRQNNIFGIKGLTHDLQPGTSPKRIYPADTAVESEEKENHHDTASFTTVTSKRTIPTTQPFDLRIPAPSTMPLLSTAADTPELLKFSHTNPFSAIQLNNQTHPLLKEFSYSWEESEILNDSGLKKENMNPDGLGKLEVRKRLAGADFEKKKNWEMKRFKKAGCDLGRYNRGDFGPRMGIGRL